MFLLSRNNRGLPQTIASKLKNIYVLRFLNQGIILQTTVDNLTWSALLGQEKQKSYFQTILNFVQNERQKGVPVYPPAAEVFNALKLTPFEKVKVVILGQDPYHGPNQAMGLSFSVAKGVKKPPSLQNIFKELHNDLGITVPSHGCLKSWAEQGVLLLNATLTVQANKAHSHADIGWQTFTDKVIKSLNSHPKGVVFMLWGSSAQKKETLIDNKKHCILKAPHPSPLSAHRGFLGCHHFSKANAWLISQGRKPIDWSIKE